MDPGGISGILFPRDTVDHFPARGFDAAGRCSGRKNDLPVSGIELAGRHFCERLTKNAAALHDLERTHQQPGAHIAGLLHRHVEFHLGVGRIGRCTAKILRDS